MNKSQEIKKALAAAPGKGPKEISEALIAKGVDVSPAYVSTIKTNMKAKTGSPKKAAKSKVASKKKMTVKNKVLRQKPAPKATLTSKITYDQLRMAKDLAQQLGGIEKAKETLAALSELATD